jgi:ribosomal protein S18 acetylase RimI-like enzyme
MLHSGATIRVRRATAADVPPVLDCVNRAYRGAGGWTTEQHLLAGRRADPHHVDAYLVDPRQRFLLVAELIAPADADSADADALPPPLAAWAADAVAAGRVVEDEDELVENDPAAAAAVDPNRRATVVVGTVSGARTAAPAVAELGFYSVRPELQGRGLGRLLLRACERRCVALLGASSMVLYVVHLRAELIAFYVRNGYVETGETADFPPEFLVYRIDPSTDIHFALLRKTLRPPLP